MVVMAFVLNYVQYIREYSILMPLQQQIERLIIAIGISHDQLVICQLSQYLHYSFCVIVLE
jgi:hypothetical protein